jgi:hypothetical protein
MPKVNVNDFITIVAGDDDVADAFAKALERKINVAITNEAPKKKARKRKKEAPK